MDAYRHRYGMGRRDTAAVQSGRPDWALLMPLVILSHGTRNPPIERLIGVQSGIAAVVHGAARLGKFFCFSPDPPAGP